MCNFNLKAPLNPGITSVKKVVIISTTANVMSANATGPMCKECRSADPFMHSSSVSNVIRAKSPLKLSVWRKYLRDHPSEQFAQKLLQLIEFGVPIGYKGPDYSRICPNWPSSRALAKFKNHCYTT